MPRVTVSRITVPAMSTIGYGYGTDADTGEPVTFCEGHRYMRHLGEELQQAVRDTGELQTITVDDWMLLP